MNLFSKMRFIVMFVTAVCVLFLEKRFVDTARVKSADLKNEFLFKSFAAFRASLKLGKAADCHMLLRMIGEIKVSRDLFGCMRFCRLSLRNEGVSRNRSPSRLRVSPMYNFLQRVQVMQ